MEGVKTRARVRTHTHTRARTEGKREIKTDSQIRGEGDRGYIHPSPSPRRETTAYGSCLGLLRLIYPRDGGGRRGLGGGGGSTFMVQTNLPGHVYGNLHRAGRVLTACLQRLCWDELGSRPAVTLMEEVR